MRNILIAFVLSFMTGCESDDFSDRFGARDDVHPSPPRTCFESPPSACYGTDENEDSDSADSGDSGNESDTGNEETNAMLVTRFTSSWSAPAAFGAEPGENVNLGAIMFASGDSSEMFIANTNVQFYVNSTPASDISYTKGEEDGITASDILDECWFSDVVNTTTLYAGAPISVTQDGHLLFTSGHENDDVMIWLTDGAAVAASVMCSLHNNAPSGVGIAVDIDTNNNSTAYAGSPNDESNPLVDETVTTTNGEQVNNSIINPIVAAIIE
ncbi:MAG: hypothetical protein UY72_C0064G0006 [Candidatus Uhrbacteria bacterium GW2011_GWD2_52_7]|uniref:Uncharacterized protein n=1 Tax=Candidatus Uhrbacteria bacterium GW2011_GWD2_52_7 TaxID=1618989 RepID=A0A0G1XBL2_9BACT|nr:MAG: hypothetical protein UY72_C0064G0006 [Candidatus Uhrbacteria bacterium GW2011_GWD2_52_7]